MKTEDEDLEATREALANSDMHAIHHANNVDEHDEIQRHLERLKSRSMSSMLW